MSHEIRTPMNAILGYAQILARNTGLHPFQRDAIGTISSSCDHLLQLVNGILDLSKIDAGRMEICLAPFDLSALLRQLAGMFQPPCEEKLLGFRYEGPSQVLLPVRGDEGKLRQVLINLLGNAVKFTAQGRVILRAVQKSEELWRFEVEDTGGGIAEAEKDAIFAPFRQGQSHAGRGGGTGLGLTIARRQVELMGARLELISSSPQGSLFGFTLALPPEHGSVHGARPAARRYERLAEGCKVRALVVDDILENREVLALMLRAVGCEVGLAENGRQALEAVRLSHPDIVFMDMRLPDVGGAEVLRQLVSEDRPGLKLVATSASALVHQGEEYCAAGADVFVAKPFRAERIYECLVELLGVAFTGSPEAIPAESAEIVNLGSIALPEELVSRLVMAAELHSATVLKNCLCEVEARGPAGARLAEHLRGFLASYDMASIQRLVAQIPIASPSLPAEDRHAA
jgi:CheY-like chemotaxis protein